MLPERLPATWPPGGTRDAKYKDHAMRGRKPKPTALKLLDGTRADRINHDEPAMPPASIEPPDWLDRPPGHIGGTWPRFSNRPGC